MKRYFWLGSLCIAGTLWAYARAQDPAYPATETPSASAPLEAVPAPAESQPLPPSQAPAKPPDVDPAKRLYSPDIWRLPPVVAPAPPPLALMLPPAETLPRPAPEPPPTANAPAALSGVLSLEQPLKIKPSAPEKLWDGSFDLGLDGSEGNSETLNFRFGFHANRKTPSHVLTLNLDYNRRTADTVTNTNRAFFDGRNEWLIHESRWSWFLHETIEYDEFQSFNVRDTSDIGLGYRLIKSDTTTLIGRFGAGFSHESGGPENGDFIPEAVFGMQFEHQISKRQKLLGAAEYAPDVADFERYRLRTQAALEVLLDEERHLSLRVGVLERYNSMPDGARPNDLDYAMVFLWKF